MKKILVLMCVLVLLALCFVSCSCNGEDVPNNQNPNAQVPQNVAKVKFETYIDVKIDEQQVSIGGRVKSPSVTLSRPGYTFVGWYNGDKPWDFANSPVTGDMTLTAKWQSYLSYVAVSEIENEYVKNLLGESKQDGVIVVGCEFPVKEVVIPETYNGKKVVGIYWAFAGRREITSVVIPETVMYISTNAFNRCEGLTKVVIPSSVSVIEQGAFFLCENLEGIYCRADEKPIRWSGGFDLKSSQSQDRHKVVYGYEGN